MREIPGWDGYWATEEGRIFSTKRRKPNQEPKELHRHIDRYGYYTTSLMIDNEKSATMLVHRLVLSAFRGLPEGDQQARHMDGNKLNNHIDNLVWGTVKENGADKVRHGTTAKGEKNGWSALTNRQVEGIKWLLAVGIRGRYIASLYGCTEGMISNIKRGRTWQWLRIE